MVNPTANVTLEQALALSLLHNPQLEAYAWHIRASEASVLQSQLTPNPLMGVKIENIGGSNNMHGFDSAVSTLRISQAIELGDKRLKRMRLAQQEQTLSGWDYETQRLEVIAQTGHRYIDVLAAQHNLKLAQQALKLAKELHSIASDQLDQGVIAKSECYKAQVQVTARKIDLENQTRQLAILRQQLAAMWGSSDVSFKELKGNLFKVSDQPKYEYLAKHLEQNPDLARWTTEIAKRKAMIEVADADAVPNLTVGAGIRRFNVTNDNAFVFEMTIPLPLKNRNQGARRKARYDLLQAKTLQRHSEITARTMLHKQYQRLSAEHFAVTSLADKGLPAAQAAFDSSLEAFKQGVTDYLSVLDAERTLIAIKYDYFAALANYHKYLISLESFLGISIK